MHSKGNYRQGEKTTLIMAENNNKWNKWQKINFQNIQAAHTTQYLKKQTTLSKRGKGAWRDISPKKTYRWLTSTWKDSQHHSLLEKCKSKLQWDTTSHQSEWPSSKSLQTINFGEGVEKREHSCIAGRYWYSHYGRCYAAAAAKSLQSCPTLCDPIDVSPPVSPIPGILQARTLEWVAISFPNAWKWKVKSFSRVRLLATPWIVAHQAPLSMGFSRQEYWSGVPLPSPGR